MKKIFLGVMVAVFMLALMTGCNTTKVATDSVTEKLSEASKRADARTVKANMESIQKQIEQLYAETNELPDPKAIEGRLFMPLSQMQIEIVKNKDGTYTLKNTNTKVSKTDAPDYTFKPE